MKLFRTGLFAAYLLYSVLSYTIVPAKQPSERYGGASAAEAFSIDDQPMDSTSGAGNLIHGVFYSRRIICNYAVFGIAALLCKSKNARAFDSIVSTSVNTNSELEQQGLLSTDRVAALLHAVPTFTIVDRKGAPFMVVGEDAKVTGYFFTEYDEADRILKLARNSADKAIAESKKDPSVTNPEDFVNPWKQARISTVPMDIAVSLITKFMYAKPAKFGGGNYFQIAPSEQDITDALTITKKNNLAEGKVPLFYYENFVIEREGVKQSPLFFRKSELEQAFRKEQPGQKYPEILVSELFAILAEMVKPDGTDEALKTLVFVAPKESSAKAKECERRGGKEAAFLLGQRILVL